MQTHGRVKKAKKTTARAGQLVSVELPRLIDESGKRYWLDGQGRVVKRRPKTAFKGKPELKWRKPNADGLWGPKAALLRERIVRALMNAASKANVVIEAGTGERDRDDDVIRRSPSRKTKLKKTKKTKKTKKIKQIPSQVVLYHAGQIVAAGRLSRGWHLAWGRAKLPTRAIPMQVGVTRRNTGTTDQLRALASAVSAGTSARVEVRWRQATPAARFVLQRVLDETPDKEVRALGPLKHEPGSILSTPIPARHVLATILPKAVALASLRHGPVYDENEALLLVCRQAFLGVTLGKRDLMTPGNDPVPRGDGADFVRQVERILGIPILPKKSHHMIKRVRKSAEIHSRRRKLPFGGA